MITSRDLSSVFGKTEMEAAAAKIVNRAMEANSWDIPFTEEDFREDNGERTGIFYLGLHGWLHDDGGRNFVVSKEFAEKVIERLADETMRKYVAEHVRVNEDWADG